MPENPGDIETNPFYYDILYGALLHDIGKFFWRADKTQPSRYSKLSKEDVGLSGAHSKWSAEFFQTYLKGNLFEDVHNDIIEALILYHHNPESRQIKIDAISQNNLKKLIQVIQIADHASSGERIKREVEEDYGATRVEVLHSIFSNVKLEKRFSSESYYSLYPLTSGEHAREVLFPMKTREEAYGKYASDTQPLYKQLYSDFISELELIIKNLKKITFSTLFNLLFKFTINIPSATYVDIPDISLFDHLKTTVSIAACLFLDLIAESNNSLENLTEESIANHKKKRYLLLEGNISGIQNFIYSISSKGAAKGLKGRSFFVQYLGELISKYLLDNLNLPTSCEIYCDGGNFYSIIPACYEEDLTRLSFKIKSNLYNMFKGDLFIDIRWVQFNRYNLLIEPEVEEPFSSLWDKINSLVGKEKFQRYNDILKQSDGYNRIFSPQGVGGLENRICSICKQEKYVIAEEEKCPLCKSFEQLTRDLINTKYILIMKL
ncbi:CRISPR system single-strand-specific deoxyribonuclease Cas10/Csm1 (subtype III-A) [subsurface metagenome]